MIKTQQKTIGKPDVTVTSDLVLRDNGDMVSGIKVNNTDYKVLVEAEYVRKIGEVIEKMYPTISNRTNSLGDDSSTGNEDEDEHEDEDDGNNGNNSSGDDANSTDVDANKAIIDIQNYLLGNDVDGKLIGNTGRIEEFSKVITNVQKKLNADITSIEKYIPSTPSSNQNTGTNMTDNNRIGTAIAVSILVYFFVYPLLF